jgi:hypothetical protein
MSASGIYIVTTGAMPTTAASVKISTGTAIKTLLQIATSATRPILVTEWGLDFDGNVANTPVQVELIDTYAIAATVTAHVAAGVQAFDALADTPASTVTLGTSATGYNASAEGSITQTRYGDLRLLPPTQPYIKQFPLGKEFYVPVSHILRIRVTAGTSVNASGSIQYQEI